MGVEESPTAILNRLVVKQRNLKRKIGRAQESGNFARLVLYHAELVEIGRDLETMSVDCAVVAKDALAEPPKPVLVLRRSYGLEAFVEGLIFGRKVRRTPSASDLWP